METKSNRLYAEMPPVKLFFHAAIPGVVSMFAMSVYNIFEGRFCPDRHRTGQRGPPHRQ